MIQRTRARLRSQRNGERPFGGLLRLLVAVTASRIAVAVAVDVAAMTAASALPLVVLTGPSVPGPNSALASLHGLAVAG